MRSDETLFVNQYLSKLLDLEFNALFLKKPISIQHFRTAISGYIVKEQIFLSDPNNSNKNIFHYLALVPVDNELLKFFSELIQLSETTSPNPLWEKMLLHYSYDLTPMQYALTIGNFNYACLIFNFQFAKFPAEAVLKLQDVITTVLQMFSDMNYLYFNTHHQFFKFLEYTIKRIENMIRSKENNVELSQNSAHQITEKVNEETINPHEQTETVQSETQRLKRELLIVKEKLNKKLLTSGLNKATDLIKDAQINYLSSCIDELNNTNRTQEETIRSLTAEVNQARLEIELLKANPQISNTTNLYSVAESVIHGRPPNPFRKVDTLSTPGYRKILPNSSLFFGREQRPNKHTTDAGLQSPNTYSL